ncbi:MAG: adenylate/guanylate cyclase domain-containing protein [Bacteroidales bacterium]
MKRRKNALFYTVLLLFPILSLNQLKASKPDTDSLITLLAQHQKNDSVRANILYDIAFSQTRSNPTRCIQYADSLENLGLALQNNKDIDLAQKIILKAWLLKGNALLLLSEKDQAQAFFNNAIETTQQNGDKNTEAKTLFEIGKIWHSVADYDQALEYYNKALALEKGLNNPSEMAMNLYQIGTAYDDKGDLYSATDYTLKAHAVFLQLGDDAKIAKCLNNLGNYQNSMGNTIQALEYFQGSLKINEQLRDSAEISNNLNNIGVVYMIMENFIKAREYYQQSYNIVEKKGDKKNMMYGLGNIGITYSYEENFELALEYFNKVLLIAKELGDKQNIARSYGNIGRVYEDMNSLSEALKYYTIAFSIHDSIGNKFGSIYTLVGLGDVNRKLGNVEIATGQLYKGLAIAREIGASNAEKDALQVITEMYAQLGQYDSAYHYLMAYTNLKDTLLNEENIEEITRKEMQYSFDKKMIEEKLIAELEINKQKSRKNLFLFTGLGILVLAAGLWSRLRYIRKSKSIIEKERDRSESLLLNILPAEVAEELKEKGHADAKHFDEVTVLFTDFKGFTKIAEKLTAQELVNEIDYCFKKFDEITSKYHIEKIKTIGDAYMCAGGLPVPNKTNTHDMVRAALEIQQFMKELKEIKTAENKPFFELRIGIHTGPVVAGIVGIKKFQYDIWGDTVNIAAHMESAGEVGKVNISQYTFEKVKDHFKCIHRGKIEAKGKGMIDMYFVEA